jgi:hypothetical protein
MPFQHDPTPMLRTLQLGNSPPAHHTALPSRHALLLGVSMPSRSPTAHTVQGRSRSSSRPTLPLLYFSLLCLTVPLPHVSRPRAATPDRSITWPSFTPPSPHAADPSRPAPCRLPAARSFACAFPSSTIQCLALAPPCAASKRLPILFRCGSLPCVPNNAQPFLCCSACTLPLLFIGARFMATALQFLSIPFSRNSNPCRAGPSHFTAAHTNALAPHGPAKQISRA